MITAASGTPSRKAAPTTRETSAAPLARVRRFAWLAIVIADAGLLAWGAMTALAPACPGACMTSGYESFTQQSWAALESLSAASRAHTTPTP